MKGTKDMHKLTGVCNYMTVFKNVARKCNAPVDTILQVVYEKMLCGKLKWAVSWIVVWCAVVSEDIEDGDLGGFIKMVDDAACNKETLTRIAFTKFIYWWMYKQSMARIPLFIELYHTQPWVEYWEVYKDYKVSRGVGCSSNNRNLVDRIGFNDHGIGTEEVMKVGIDSRWADIIDPNNPRNVGFEGEEGVDWVWVDDKTKALVYS